jgi:hypothetical protein
MLGVVGVIAVSGCGQDRAPAPAASSPPSAAIEDETVRATSESSDPGGVAEAAAPQALPTTPEMAQTSSSAAAAEPKDEEAAGKPSAADPPADDAQFRERIALLTPGGPLLVDVWLTLDGRPHKELFATRIKQVLDAGAAATGRPTWADLAANEKFLQAERAANPGSARSRAKTWTERFDLNRDQQIQPAEAAAWLGRDAGHSVAALSLRSRRSYRALPALNSRVWQLLDVDRNGRLDTQEIDAAPDKLLSLDANDDRILVPPELARLRDQLGEATAVPRFDVGGSPSFHAALHLEQGTDIERLDYVFGDLYAPRQTLGPTSFPELSRLFSELDANGDRRLEPQELAGLSTTEPHLTLSIAFDQPAADAPAQARLHIRQHAPELSIVAQPASNRAVVALGSTRITVSAHDFGGPNAPDQPGERCEIRAMIHDEGDALFDELDRNADGRLGEREIAVSPARMLERDHNQDGQLTSDELPSTMIVAFLRSERPAEQSFYLPDFVATPEQVAGAPAWFAAADLNGDGDVSRREFLGPIEQFFRLDADQNGFIAVEEAVSSPAK